MEAIMIAMVPVALAWMALSHLSGGSLDPTVASARIVRLLLRLLRLAIQGRCQRSGAARVQRPRLRYWDLGEDDR